MNISVFFFFLIIFKRKHIVLCSTNLHGERSKYIYGDKAAFTLVSELASRLQYFLSEAISTIAAAWGAAAVGGVNGNVVSREHGPGVMNHRNDWKQDGATSYSVAWKDRESHGHLMAASSLELDPF